MATPDPSALRTEIFGSAFLLAQYLARRTDGALEPLGVTTKQWLLLAVLVRKFPRESPTLSEAALWYGSSRQNVKQIARQLEDRGWLRLVPDAGDRRVLRLELTDRIAAFQEPREVARQEALMKGLFQGLGPADLRQLRDLLGRWLQNVVPR
jgi:DNA-binding MarR family transcriptional regulator